MKSYVQVPNKSYVQAPNKKTCIPGTLGSEQEPKSLADSSDCPSGPHSPVCLTLAHRLDIVMSPEQDLPTISADSALKVLGLKIGNICGMVYKECTC
jgi:hypothetical protein